MVRTDDINVTSAFTNGVPVKEIYTYGQYVWPSHYYIKWWPQNISTGTFTIDGTTYNFSDYSGEFRFSTGVITTDAFRSNTTITSIKTNAYSIGARAFMDCTSLKNISLPYCESVDFRAFDNCSRSLSQISLPYCKYIGNMAFQRTSAYLSTALFSLYAPVCSFIGDGAFEYRGAISTLSLPNCEYIGKYAFEECFIDNDLYLPKCSYIGSAAFVDCIPPHVYLSVCEHISGDFNFQQQYGNYIDAVYIYTSSVCKLDGQYTFKYVSTNDNWYQRTVIRVPASLVSAYKAAKNWSLISTFIGAIPS